MLSGVPKCWVLKMMVPKGGWWVQYHSLVPGAELWKGMGVGGQCDRSLFSAVLGQ